VKDAILRLSRLLALHVRPFVLFGVPCIYFCRASLALASWALCPSLTCGSREFSRCCFLSFQPKADFLVKDAILELDGLGSIPDEFISALLLYT
jgi:hypothetical protein